jgi:hypothetical protein
MATARSSPRPADPIPPFSLLSIVLHISRRRARSGGPACVLAAITEPDVLRKILTHVRVRSPRAWSERRHSQRRRGAFRPRRAAWFSAHVDRGGRASAWTRSSCQVPELRHAQRKRGELRPRRAARSWRHVTSCTLRGEKGLKFLSPIASRSGSSNARDHTECEVPIHLCE